MRCVFRCVGVGVDITIGGATSTDVMFGMPFVICETDLSCLLKSPAMFKSLHLAQNLTVKQLLGQA